MGGGGGGGGGESKRCDCTEHRSTPFVSRSGGPIAAAVSDRPGLGPDRRHLTRQTPDSHLVSLALFKAWPEPLRVRRAECAPKVSEERRSFMPTIVWGDAATAAPGTRYCGNSERQTEMGAGIAASPHCAERRICRYSQPGLIKAFALPTRSRSWLTSSGVASHRAVPSFEEPGCLLDCAARRFACRSSLPGPV